MPFASAANRAALKSASSIFLHATKRRHAGSQIGPKIFDQASAAVETDKSLGFIGQKN
jgi:hypothetical protein